MRRVALGGAAAIELESKDEEMTSYLKRSEKAFSWDPKVEDEASVLRT